MVRDIILSIDGKEVHIADELSYEIMRRAYKPVDVEVLRNGERITITDVTFPTEEESDQIFGMMDFKVYQSEKNIGSILTYSFSKSILIVRMCWESIYDLITGRYTFAAVSGPVGISATLGDAFKAGLTTFIYIIALISINLGVMNLLPFPALDGFRMVTTLFEMITRKRIPQNIEGIINGIGLLLLLGLSVIVLVKDSLQLIF